MVSFTESIANKHLLNQKKKKKKEQEYITNREVLSRGLGQEQEGMWGGGNMLKAIYVLSEYLFFFLVSTSQVWDH